MTITDKIAIFTPGIFQVDAKTKIRKLWGYLGHDLGGGLLELGNLLGGGVHLNSLGLPLHRLLLPRESTGRIRTERRNTFLKKVIFDSSVADPDPDIFGPPGSGFLCTAPDPSIIKQKYEAKSFFLLICDFF